MIQREDNLAENLEDQLFPKSYPEGSASEAEGCKSTLTLRSISLRALDLVLIFGLSAFICFHKLDKVSLYIPDEVYEVQAAIEMMQGERWWLPTHHGEPWLHKPPLKMWLSWPAMRTISSPNLSFRFVDAASGVLLSLLVAPRRDD